MGEVFTALFHKLEIDGKVYYQCRYVVPEFTPNERFDNLIDRNESGKKDFYVTASSEKLSVRGIKEDAIFVDNNGLRIVDDQKLLSYIKTKFLEEGSKKNDKQSSSHPQELVDAYVTKINDEAKCQKKAIKDIISTIVYNRELNNSNLTTLTKNMHHDNIVMFGPVGTGDDIIIEAVNKNLQIPVVKISLTGDVENDSLIIAKNIEESNKKFDGQALVIVDCDYQAFAEQHDGDSFYPLRELMTYTGVYKSPYLKKPINFNELTYLTSVNVSDDMMKIGNLDAYFMKLTGCTKAISLRKLTMTQMRNVLYNSTYSVLKYCDETAKKYNREFAVNRKAIGDAIRFVDFFGGHMAMLNSSILESFKEQLETGTGKIVIGLEVLDYLQNIIQIANPSIDDAPINDTEEELEEEVSNELLDREKKIDELTEKIKEVIKGQDKQVRDLVTAIIDNQEIANDPKEEYPESNKLNILIRGASGTGKTEIIRLIAKYLGIPIVVEDATRYTEEGYVGESPTDMLLNLYRETGENIEKAERGIIVIDEIDKKANNGALKSDVSRGAVLDSLLKMVEGEKYQLEYKKAIATGNVVQTVKFDTRRLTFVILGAFFGLDKIKEERIKAASKPKSMGFKDSKEQKEIKEELEGINKDFINKDYIEFGFTDQFINRFDEKIYLSDISREIMIEIMKYSTKSPLLLLQNRFAKYGIEIEYSDDFCEKLADIAMTKNSGARSIKEVFGDLKKYIGFNGIRKSNLSKIIFTAECFNNPEALVLVEKGKVLRK